MLFEEIDNWDTMVNYNNFFRLECRNWLLNQQLLLGGFHVNGQPTYVEVDETCFSIGSIIGEGSGVGSGSLVSWNEIPVVVGWKWLFVETQLRWNK